MLNKKYYSIGEVSDICGVSKKALRHYNQLGVINPDLVKENNYRYYSRSTMLSIPVVKYYKQMGFKLEEMKEFITGNTYSVLENSFREKIVELKAEDREIFKKLLSVKDWYELIIEAQMVIENKVDQVAVKFIHKEEYCFMDQNYSGDIMEAIINVSFTNYIEDIENEIIGPVIIGFPSYKDRMNGKVDKIKIMQKTIDKCEKNQIIELGEAMFISCYHIGSHEKIGKTYEKMSKWITKHNYKCKEESYERYVTDYWTTKNPNIFVTEIMIEISD